MSVASLHAGPRKERPKLRMGNERVRWCVGGEEEGKGKGEDCLRDVRTGFYECSTHVSDDGFVGGVET